VPIVEVGVVNDLVFESAATVCGMIRDKRISAKEVVRASLDRIEEVNSQLNAVVRLAADRALEEAREADKLVANGQTKGPLHGLPITIKDSIDTVGIITTGGTKGRSAFVPTEDATVVARLRQAGAIVIGKTNTPELTLSFETDNEVYGRTNNPYDPSRTCGGSSGGAGAIVSAGGSYLDIGSDTVGSVRVPAHCCGIAGIRPTSGRVPRTGHIIPYGLGSLDSLTTLGPMARYVDDLAFCLPVVVGIDWRDPAIIPMPLGDANAVELKEFRIAFFTDNGIVTPTVETIQAVEDSANSLVDIGMGVEEARPDAIVRTLDVFLSLWRTYSGAWRQKLLVKAGTIEATEKADEEPLSAASLADLAENVGCFRSEMLAFMEEYDILICPVNAYPALPHGSWSDNMPAYSYTAAFNLTGWPVVVARAGTSPEGLPIGVQIVARPWCEHQALATAKQIERIMGGWRKPPI
jgi:amidase